MAAVLPKPHSRPSARDSLSLGLGEDQTFCVICERRWPNRRDVFCAFLHLLTPTLTCDQLLLPPYLYPSKIKRGKKARDLWICLPGHQDSRFAFGGLWETSTSVDTLVTIISHTVLLHLFNLLGAKAFQLPLKAMTL